MASLYQTTQNARKAVLVVLIAVIAILVYQNFFAGGDDVIESNEQTRVFMFAARELGDVTVPNIPALQRDTDNKISYSLESVYPTFPDVAYVYAVEKPTEKLGTFSRAQDTAGTLGFDKFVFDDLGDGDFSWNASANTKKLNYNKISQVWDMNTTYTANVDAIEATTRNILRDDKNVYAARTKNLLSDLGFNTFGFESGRVEVRYASLDISGEFIYQDRVVDSNFVFLDVFRRIRFADLKPSGQRPKLAEGQSYPEPVDALVYTSDPLKGQIRVIASGELNEYSKNVFDLEFTNFEYTQETGTYLIISPDEAWNNVQTGKGSLVLLQAQNTNLLGEFTPLNVSRYIADARKTELAYWEPEVWDGYVYPIYIFRGRAELENGRQATFVFYVDAIKRLD